jgi:hypothetical protein
MEKSMQIEEKVKNLKDELQKQTAKLSEFKSALKVTRSNILMIEGAIQAYLESIRIMKEPERELQEVSEK